MAVPIEIRKEIQKRALEIKTYRSHYLYEEARIRCQELAAFIRKAPGIPDKEQLLGQLTIKIKKINAEMKAFDDFSSSVQMSAKEQTVVRELFTSGKGQEADSAFETAKVLLTFGQQKLALKAFRDLLKDGKHRVAAAKGILRCHLMEGQAQKAANEYLVWFKGDHFPRKALDLVRIFLQAALNKKGFRQELPIPVMADEIETQIEPGAEEEVVDYLSVVLPYVADGEVKKEILLDITFQSENMITCIVPGVETGLPGFLTPGKIFPEVQINAVDMITFRKVRLMQASKIKVGKYAGDTTISMKVLDD